MQIQTVIKNRESNCDYYIVVKGEAQLRVQLADKRIITKTLGLGYHFLNQEGLNRKLVVLPGCVVVKISAKTLVQKATELREMANRLRIMK